MGAISDPGARRYGNCAYGEVAQSGRAPRFQRGCCEFDPRLLHVNSKQIGSLGVANAIAYYTNLEYAVFIPVSDVSRYDLIVDTGTFLKRVEVKTVMSDRGTVDLRTLGKNTTPGVTEKRISTEDCDEVFCYNAISKNFKIFSSSELAGRATVTVK